MFNFWPFNVARKRREAEREKRIAQLVEDMDRPQPKRNKVIPMDDPRHPRNLSPQQRADKLAQMRAKASEMFARTEQAHLLAQVRAAGLRPALRLAEDQGDIRGGSIAYRGSSKGTTSSTVHVNRNNLPRDQPFAGTGLHYDYDADPSRLVAQFSDERLMEPAPAEAVAQVQQFRCTHPAISEFWQEQQARCDSPTDTSSPSCDAPPTDQ